MYTESRLADLSKSLASGFFADRVVRFLSKYDIQGTTPLNTEEVALVTRVRKFLGCVLKGVRWPTAPDLSFDSVISVELYSKAYTVKPKYDARRFENYIKELSDIADKISNQSISQKELTELTTFFRAFRKAVSNRAEMVYLHREKREEMARLV